MGRPSPFVQLLCGMRDQGVTLLEKTVIDTFECAGSHDDDVTIGDAACGQVRMTLQTTGADGHLRPDGALEAELYLACLGRKPRAKSTSLQLEAHGVHLDEKSGHILVDSDLRTSQPSMYAAGDCIHGPALASTGVDQAQRAVINMFGQKVDMTAMARVSSPWRFHAILS